jgi:hypothetical protein
MTGPRRHRLSLQLGHGRRGTLIGSEHKRIKFKASASSGAFVLVDPSGVAPKSRSERLMWVILD